MASATTTATTTAGFQFEESSHSYYSPGGLWLPGVTRILTDNGYSPGLEWFTQESRERGKAVHYACQLVDQHCPELMTLEEVLDFFSARGGVLDQRLYPYVSGYLMFKREKGFIPELNEVVVGSLSMNACGTFDKWGRYRDGRRVMVDLKSWKSQGARPKPSAEVQLGGYELMGKESLGIDVDLRVVLALPGNWKYRSYDCTDAADKVVFRANAMVWWHKQQKGILQMGGPSEVEMAA